MSGTSNRAALLGVAPTVLNGVTALSGGGISAATPVMAEAFNRVTTVAAIGDSVALPPATAGLTCVVTNAAAANPMDVFPAFLPTGDVINALAAAVALRINAQTTLEFRCTVAGVWQTSALETPAAKFTSINVTVGTLAAGIITGATVVTVLSTNATPGNQTTRTATQMFADAGNVQPGDGYLLQICNSGAGTLTLLAGGGVTFGSGTYTVPTNTMRTFACVFTSAVAMTIQTTGVGTWS